MSSSLPPWRRRTVRRLALAGALVAITGVALGLDAAMAVAFSLAVTEVDACSP
jgi:hypothetical protein